jgi:hypothetical protein
VDNFEKLAGLAWLDGLVARMVFPNHFRQFDPVDNFRRKSTDLFINLDVNQSSTIYAQLFTTHPLHMRVYISNN